MDDKHHVIDTLEAASDYESREMKLDDGNKLVVKRLYLNTPLACDLEDLLRLEELQLSVTPGSAFQQKGYFNYRLLLKDIVMYTWFYSRWPLKKN